MLPDAIFVSLRIIVAVLIVIGAFTLARLRAEAVWNKVHMCQCESIEILRQDDRSDFANKSAAGWLVLYVPLALALVVHPLAGEIVSLFGLVGLFVMQLGLSSKAKETGFEIDEFYSSSGWSFFILNIMICLLAAIFYFFDHVSRAKPKSVRTQT